MIRFEFDPDKSAANKDKHGIDFVQAQLVWEDEKRIIVQARSDTEVRYMAVGMIDGKLWAAFHTLRGDKIRIFSVRRARQGDKTNYDQQRDET